MRSYSIISNIVKSIRLEHIRDNRLE